MSWWNPTSRNSSNPTPPLPPADSKMEPSGGWPSSLGGVPGSGSPESYETAKPSIFSGIFGRAKEAVGQAASRAGDFWAERFNRAIETTRTWRSDASSEVDRAFSGVSEAIEETFDNGVSWLGESAEAAAFRFEETQEQAQAAIESFGDRAENAFEFARDVGEAWWENTGEDLEATARQVQKHGDALREGLGDLADATWETGRAIYRTGVEFRDAAVETRDLVRVHLDSEALDPGLLEQDLIRLSADVRTTNGGDLFSAGLDAVSWTVDSALTVDTVADQATDKLEDWADKTLERVSDGIADELGELEVEGPRVYVSERAGELFDRVRNSSFDVGGALERAEQGARQLSEEYFQWEAKGNSVLGAATLTLVGDDDYLSPAEVRGAIERKEDVGTSALARVITEDFNRENDPNAAVFVNGILNSQEWAVANARWIHSELGKNVDIVYNPTHSPLVDVLQAGLVDKQGLVDTSTQLLVDHIRTRLASPELDGTLEVFAHSQGAIITSAAVSQLTPDERSRLEVVTFGGAAYTYPPGLARLRAIVNTRDMVPHVLGSGVGLLNRTDNYESENYSVEFVEFGQRTGDWVPTHKMEGYVQEFKRGTHDTRWELMLQRFLEESR